jgi:hypothetical protein
MRNVNGSSTSLLPGTSPSVLGLLHRTSDCLDATSYIPLQHTRSMFSFARMDHLLCHDWTTTHVFPSPFAFCIFLDAFTPPSSHSINDTIYPYQSSSSTSLLCAISIFFLPPPSGFCHQKSIACLLSSLGSGFDLRASTWMNYVTFGTFLSISWSTHSGHFLPLYFHVPLIAPACIHPPCNLVIVSLMPCTFSFCNDNLIPLYPFSHIVPHHTLR